MFLFISNSALYTHSLNNSIFIKVFDFIKSNYNNTIDTHTTLKIIEKFYIVLEIQDIKKEIIFAYFDLLFTFLKNINEKEENINNIGYKLSNYNTLLMNYPEYFVEFLDRFYTLTLKNSIPLIIVENYLSIKISHLFEFYQGDIRTAQLLFLMKCDILIKQNDLKTLYSKLRECEISLCVIHLIISLAFNDKTKRIPFIKSLNETPINNNNLNENLRFDDINIKFFPITQYIKNFDFYKELLKTCVDLLTVHNNEYYFQNEIENKDIFIVCYKFMFNLFKELIDLSQLPNNIKEYTLACFCFSTKHSLYGELVKYFISTYSDDIDIVIDDIISITNSVLIKYNNPFIFDSLLELNKTQFNCWENVFKKIIFTLFNNQKGIELNIYVDGYSYIIENIANLFYFIYNNLSNDTDNLIKIYFEKENNIKQFLDKSKTILKGEYLLYTSALFKNNQHISTSNSNTPYGFTYKTISELYFDILIKMYTDLVYETRTNFSFMLLDYIENMFILYEGVRNTYMDDFRKGYTIFYIMDNNKLNKKICVDKKKMCKLELKLRMKMIDNVVHSYYFLLKVVLYYIAYRNNYDLGELLEKICLITVYNVFLVRKEKNKFTQFEDTLPKYMKNDVKKMMKLLGRLLDHFFISEFSISIDEEPLKELLFNKFKVMFKENFVPKINNQFILDGEELFNSNIIGSFTGKNSKKSFNTFEVNTRQSSNIHNIRLFEMKEDEYITQLKLFIKELSIYNDYKESQEPPTKNTQVIYNSTKTLSNNVFQFDDISSFNRISRRSNTITNLNTSININKQSHSSFNLSLNINSNDNINNNNISKTKQHYNYFHEEKIYSFEIINKNYSLFYPKRQLLLNTFSLFFSQLYFHNDTFLTMKKYYNHIHPYLNKQQHTKALPYPSIIKNYQTLIEPSLFLKQNLSFFESPFFIKSHPYFKEQRNNILHQLKLNKIELYSKPLPNLNKRFHKAVLITPMDNKYMNISFEEHAIIMKEENEQGRIEKGNFDFIFNECLLKDVSDINKEIIDEIEKYKKRNKVVILFINDIHIIVSRRYLLRWQALEIYMKDGKSYFINLYTEQKANEFIKKLKEYKIVLYQKNDLNIQFKNSTMKWIDNEINTYNYLMLLNFYGTRTYKDPNQYPIFPWLLNNYEDIFSLSKNMSLRNFLYPISCQHESKRLELISRYIEGLDDKKWKSHFGSHYSTSAFVFYYLMRTYPFCNCLIKLQNYNQENTNRMFCSLIETQSVLEGATDSRELIPEMFSHINNFINLNCVLFGQRRNDEIVDDISFKDIHDYNDISLYVKFIIEHRKVLNEIISKKEISNWIDYVFGYKQLLQEPESCVIFQKHAYEQITNVNMKLEKLKKKFGNNEELIKKKMFSKINIIIHFGMTPYQLYKDNIFSYIFANNNQLIQQQLISSTSSLPKINKMSIICFVISNTDNILICISSTNINSHPMMNIHIISLNNQTKDETFLPITIQPFQYNSLNTIKSFSESNKAFIYYKYEHSYVFIITRYSDWSIRIYSKTQSTINIKEKSKKYITESFITCIIKGRNNLFYTGMQNGKLIQWEFFHDDLSLIQLRSIYAQLSPISSIILHDQQNILISSGTIYKSYKDKYELNNDYNIYIRKKYDFELLTPIPVSSKEQILCVKVSQMNFIYVLLYYSYLKMETVNMKLKEKTKIVGYTLSGIKFGESCDGKYRNFCIDNGGDIIVCEYNKVKVLCGGCLNGKGCERFNSKIKWMDYDRGSENVYLFKESKEWEIFNIKKVKIEECRCEKVKTKKN